MRYTQGSRQGRDEEVHLERLGGLKTKILKHMLTCHTKIESVSHISKEVNALQPDVFRSTKTMIQEGILIKQDSLIGQQKEVRLTEKGIAVAVLVGIKHKELVDYFKPKKGYHSNYDRERHIIFNTLMDLQDKSTLQGLLLKTALEYMVTHGWYEEEKKILDPTERFGLFEHLMPYIMMHPEDVKNIVRLIDKFGIDKVGFFRSLLLRLDFAIMAVLDYNMYAWPLMNDREKAMIDKSLIKNIDRVRFHIRAGIGRQRLIEDQKESK